MDDQQTGTALGEQIDEGPKQQAVDQNEQQTADTVMNGNNSCAPNKVELITVKKNGNIENVVKLVRNTLKSEKVVYVSATEHVSHKAVTILQRIRKWHRSSKYAKTDDFESFILISPAQIRVLPQVEADQLEPSPQSLLDGNSLLMRIGLTAKE
ncbi:hypothetical protein MP228_006516 [Amoeboaphelidium protococcarum]|nr:hypothetical protein MP228_006516 [Amoeboaphelidium protococcarum]